MVNKFNLDSLDHNKVKELAKKYNITNEDLLLEHIDTLRLAARWVLDEHEHELGALVKTNYIERGSKDSEKFVENMYKQAKYLRENIEKLTKTDKATLAIDGFSPRTSDEFSKIEKFPDRLSHYLEMLEKSLDGVIRMNEISRKVNTKTRKRGITWQAFMENEFASYAGFAWMETCISSTEVQGRRSKVVEPNPKHLLADQTPKIQGRRTKS
jgi:hypothetical protein